MDKARRIAKMTGKGLSTVRNILRGDADHYGEETRQAVLSAAAQLQAKAQRAALRRRETLRRKRVMVVVLCRCGEETRVSVPAVRAYDRCGSASEVFNWCASCGQLMCKGCTAGWETRPDLGRLHALVCLDCGLRNVDCGVNGDVHSEIQNPKSEMGKGGDADETKRLPTGASVDRQEQSESAKRRSLL